MEPPYQLEAVPLELPLSLNRVTNETLQSQVFEQLRQLILSGALRPGAKLPPSRFLAERTDISRNTATLAYERLASEGYIETRGKTGTYVSSALPDALFSDRVSNQSKRESGSLEFVGKRSPLLCYAGQPAIAHFSRERALATDFWIGRSEPSIFPIKMWRHIMDKKLSSNSHFMTEYGDPAGLLELRVEIAKHLGRSRGMSINPDQVIVTNGSQDALNLVCRLVDPRQHPFYIENPCYQGAAFLFKSIATRVVPIPIDDEGLVVDKLPNDKSGILFVTPSHQYPTGITLSLSRRICLLKWAESTNSYVIEDDYDSDFRYDGPPLTALAGLDRFNRVFYLGTFSKSIGAGLRLGYAVVPPHLAEAARVVKSQTNSGQPWLEQAVLAEFLSSGHFYRHLRRARTLYKSRRDRLKCALEKRFGPVKLYGSESGLHVVWRLPPNSCSAQEIEKQARNRGIGVYALNSGAAYDFDGSSRQDLLVLGYSSVSELKIDKAISILHDIIFQKPRMSRRP